MHRVVRRLLAAIEVSRLSIAFGAIANVWLMVLLARADPSLAGSTVADAPLWEVLGAGALVAAGFLAFGAALNDFLDAKHDRAFAPERPLPAGTFAPRRAMQLAAVSLCLGLLGSVAFGTASVLAALALAATILVYDAFAKHVPAVGIVLAGLSTALSMLVPAVGVGTLAPVWLAMSQTMGVGALAYVLGEKRPRLTKRSIALAAAGWVFWSLALCAAEYFRNDGVLLARWLEPQADAGGAAWRIAIPLATALLCGAFSAWKLGRSRLPDGTRGFQRGPHAAERLLRYGSLWKSIVAASWLVAADMPVAAAWIAGVAVAIFLLVAFIREAGPQLAEPVGWRS